jgi:hypothetical protein
MVDDSLSGMEESQYSGSQEQERLGRQRSAEALFLHSCKLGVNSQTIGG